MADGAPLVCALLLNWRGADMTLQCLRDLLAIDDVPLLILVIDNGSGTDEVERLRAGCAAGSGAERDRHVVELVALSENTGFTGGMNHGLEIACRRGVPFALVLNNDLRLPRGFLRPLVEALQHDAQVAAIGPTVLHPDGTVWAEGGEVAFAPNALRLNGHGRPPSAQSRGPEEVGFVPGACLLLRTSAAAEVGFFRADYFMYWEDVDLAARLRRRGHKNIWLPWVRVEHHAGSSSGGGRSPLRKFLMACNAVRYLQACGTAKGWLGWFVFDVLLWPLALLRGPRPAVAKLRGTLAGLCGHRPTAADVTRYLD